METIKPKFVDKKKNNSIIDQILHDDEVSSEREQHEEALLVDQQYDNQATSIIPQNDQLEEAPFVLEPLKNEIPLKDCLQSDSLKRIFETMDTLPQSVLHDICDCLSITSVDDQNRYISRANKGEIFFATIIEEELERKKFLTLNSLLDCLSSVKQTLKIRKQISDKQKTIQEEIDNAIRFNKSIIPTVNVSKTNGNIQVAVLINRDYAFNSSSSASTSSLSSKSSEASEHDVEALFYYDQYHEQKSRIKNFIDTAYRFRILLTDISKLPKDRLKIKLQSNQLPVIYILESTLEKMNDFFDLVYIDYLQYGENRRFLPFVIDDFKDIDYKCLLRVKSYRNNKPIYYKPLQLPLEKKALDKKVELFFQGFGALYREICDKLNDSFNQNSQRYININECR